MKSTTLLTAAFLGALMVSTTALFAQDAAIVDRFIVNVK